MITAIGDRMGYLKKRMEATTREAHTYQPRKHILPWFGPMRMNEIMPSQVREWVSAPCRPRK